MLDVYDKRLTNDFLNFDYNGFLSATFLCEEFFAKLIDFVTKRIILIMSQLKTNDVYHTQYLYKKSSVTSVIILYLSMR